MPKLPTDLRKDSFIAVAVPALVFSLSAFAVVLAPPAADAAAEDEVFVESSTPGVTLAGTLVVPDDRPVVAAIVLLSVAGPDDRDMSLGERGIFSEIAAVLAARGIASLRLDDRGVGSSGGDWLGTSFDDRLADGMAAVRALAARPELAGVSLGVGGISEGAALALAAAARHDTVDFAVAISAPVRPGRVVLAGQVDRLLASSGLPETSRQQLRSASEQLLAAVVADDEVTIREILASPAGASLLPAYRMVPTDLDGRIAFLRSPWYRSQVTFDLAADLAAIDVPVFAVYGDLDPVLDPAASLGVLRRHLREEANQLVELRAERNHLMMPAKTGAPSEYATLPNVIDRELWQEIAAWIVGLDDGDVARTRPPAEEPEDRAAAAGDRETQKPVLPPGQNVIV